MPTRKLTKDGSIIIEDGALIVTDVATVLRWIDDLMAEFVIPPELRIPAFGLMISILHKLSPEQMDALRDQLAAGRGGPMTPDEGRGRIRPLITRPTRVGSTPPNPVPVETVPEPLTNSELDELRDRTSEMQDALVRARAAIDDFNACQSQIWALINDLDQGKTLAGFISFVPEISTTAHGIDRALHEVDAALSELDGIETVADPDDETDR